MEESNLSGRMAGVLPPPKHRGSPSEALSCLQPPPASLIRDAAPADAGVCEACGPCAHRQALEEPGMLNTKGVASKGEKAGSGGDLQPSDVCTTCVAENTSDPPQTLYMNSVFLIYEFFRSLTLTSFFYFFITFLFFH